LTRTASVEFFLIIMIGIVCYLVTITWPDSISVGRFVLSMSAIFLVQTLLRDLWLLASQRFEKGRPAQPMSAFCVESAVGIFAVVVGCGLLFIPLSTRVSLGNTGWSISIFLTMLLCFVLRDYVFQWRPWRIYKEPDHVNIVVRW
jgi:hypothetical protein